MSAGARLNLPATEEAALLSSVLHMQRHDQLLALLAAGANPAAADYDSRTPLHIAASVGEHWFAFELCHCLFCAQHHVRLYWSVLDSTYMGVLIALANCLSCDNMVSWFA
jgi:ankyrin repeat protein